MPLLEIKHLMLGKHPRQSVERDKTGRHSWDWRMPWMWRDPLEEAEGWREAEAHWSRCREMWEGVSETGDDALMAAESWRGRGPGSDSPHPHGASWLTSLGVRCGISLLQLLCVQQPHLSFFFHIWETVKRQIYRCVHCVHLSIYLFIPLRQRFVCYLAVSRKGTLCTLSMLLNSECRGRKIKTWTTKNTNGRRPCSCAENDPLWVKSLISPPPDSREGLVHWEMMDEVCYL